MHIGERAIHVKGRSEAAINNAALQMDPKHFTFFINKASLKTGNLRFLESDVRG